MPAPPAEINAAPYKGVSYVQRMTLRVAEARDEFDLREGARSKGKTANVIFALTDGQRKAEEEGRSQAS